MFTQQKSLFETNFSKIPEQGGELKLLLFVKSIVRCLMQFFTRFQRNVRSRHIILILLGTFGSASNDAAFRNINLKRPKVL